MSNFYNELDSYAAGWLKNLSEAGQISSGVIDQRSIVDVQAEDLQGWTQAHFFAGIGGWPLALQIAGWPEWEPVWTGSCPCQPFSVTGKKKGVRDERHLWPDFYRLIKECKPPVVFGEQVAGKDGRKWLAGVQTDLEKLGYTVASADLCAAGVGAPHIRQRLYWVGDSTGIGWIKERAIIGRSTAGGQTSLREQRPWGDFDAIPCRDGRSRRIEPGTFPLAHGVPARVGKLCAYGNAIIPQVAAEFIKAFLEVKKCTQ